MHFYFYLRRAITSDIIAPLPMLREIRLDGNDISIVEKNAFNSASHLENLSLRDNPISCDCKLQYFVEWLGNMTELASKVHLDHITIFSFLTNCSCFLGSHGFLQDTTIP